MLTGFLGLTLPVQLHLSLCSWIQLRLRYLVRMFTSAVHIHHLIKWYAFFFLMKMSWSFYLGVSIVY